MNGAGRLPGLVLPTMIVPPPALAVLGAPDLAARLGAAGVAAVPAPEAAVVVVGGERRLAVAREAVEQGVPVFLRWPPGDLDAAAALGARAEEAGAEVGVARPLAAGLLAAVPAGFAGRLVTLALTAARGGAFEAAGWPTLLAGALDVCAALTGSHDVARLDAEADRDGTLLRAAAVHARFRTGALAQVTVRTSDLAAADEAALYAGRPGVRLEARSLDGPLCVEADGRPAETRAPGPADPEVAEVLAFAEAVAVGRHAPYPLDCALATLRLAARVHERLR